MTRRDFVAGTATVAAVAALDACAPQWPPVASPQGEKGGVPVVIIGAGIAGLTAAYRLRQAGIPVRVIEARNRIGGRMYSLRNFFADGQVCELGGELIDTNHERIRALATALAIELDDLATDDPALTRGTFYFDGAVRSERDVVEAFVPVARRIVAAIQPLGGDPDVGYQEPKQEAIAKLGYGTNAKLMVGFSSSTGLPSRRRRAAARPTSPDNGPRSVARKVRRWTGFTSPGSTARATRRGSWKADVRRASARPARLPQRAADASGVFDEASHAGCSPPRAEAT